MLKKYSTNFSNAFTIAADLHKDHRGYFRTTYNKDAYATIGVTDNFIQDNVSYSKYNVLRGMHIDYRTPKLVLCLQGEILDVIVNMDTFEWQSFTLSENRLQLYVPAGFAHGFLVTSKEAIVSYKVCANYDPKTELHLKWNNEHIIKAWPENLRPILSEKDS